MNIYKILCDNEWSAFESKGSFAGSVADIKDGFIHFSTDQQLRGTLEKHFRDEAVLVLVSIESDALINDLKWEPSRGGELFPHYYGELSMDHVSEVMIINRDQTGQWMVDPVMHAEGD